MKINCIGAFLLTLIVMAFFYHRVFEGPNEIMFSESGDGIKAYTVYAGHILNDSSYINYRNMNYPYGQSHIYTDGQFLITNIIKLLSNPFPWLEKHSIGIYNLLILFSFPLCAFFLSLILNNLKLPGWYVCLVASCISLLAPQIFRTGGHLTLTYAFCIPLSWWLLIRYYESGLKPFLLGVIIAVSTAWFFIHPYYTIAIILDNKFFSRVDYKRKTFST
jgi:hypothetical protein